MNQYQNFKKFSDFDKKYEFKDMSYMSQEN
jgi:hypothetical protein